MTRLEFEAVMKKLAVQHKIEECPNELKEEYWEKSKHLSVDEFAEWTVDTFMKSGFKFVEEANDFKAELSDLLKRMLKRKAGQMVLTEMAQYFGLEVDFDLATQDEIDQAIKEVQERKQQGQEKDFKCPDKLTPDILKILKGE